jgi:hypothetical protein
MDYFSIFLSFVIPENNFNDDVVKICKLALINSYGNRTGFFHNFAGR